MIALAELSLLHDLSHSNSPELSYFKKTTTPSSDFPTSNILSEEDITQLSKEELEILSEFLLDELSDDDLYNQIVIIMTNMRNENPDTKIVIGPVMRELKNQIENFNGKTASMLIRQAMEEL